MQSAKQQNIQIICPEDCTLSRAGILLMLNQRKSGQNAPDCSATRSDGICDAGEGFCGDCLTVERKWNLRAQQSVGSCASDCTTSTCGDRLFQLTEAVKNIPPKAMLSKCCWLPMLLQSFLLLLLQFCCPVDCTM